MPLPVIDTSGPASGASRVHGFRARPSGFLLFVFLLQIGICFVYTRRLWPWSWTDSGWLSYTVAQNTFASSWQLQAFKTPVVAVVEGLAQRLFPEHLGTALFAWNLACLGAAGLLAITLFVRNARARMACVLMLALLYAASFPVFALQSGSQVGAGALCFFGALWVLRHPRGQVPGGGLFALSVLLAPPFLAVVPAFLILSRPRAWLGFLAVALLLVGLDVQGWTETVARFGANWRDFFFTDANQAQSMFMAALFNAIPTNARYLQGWIFVASKAMGPLLLVLDLLLLLRLRKIDATDGSPVGVDGSALLLALSLPVLCLLPFGSHPLLLCLIAPLLPALAANLSSSASRGQKFFWWAAALGAALASVRLSSMYSTGYLSAQIPLLGVLLFGITGVLLKLAMVSQMVPKPWLDTLYDRYRERGSPNFLYLISEMSIAHWAVGIPLGLALWCACLLVYHFYNFSFSVVTLWLAALFCFFCVWDGLKVRWRDLADLSRRDWRYLLGLVLLLAPAYTVATYQWPYQIATDELSFCGYIKVLMADRYYDFFRVATEYFCWPAGCFVLLGFMTQAMGDSSLENIRLANGLLGIVSILGIYMLGRHFFSRKHAFLWAILFGVSHTFLIISRMALRDTIPVLLEIFALLIFYRSLRKKNAALLYLAGFVAGLGVYNYYSGRVVIVICSAAMAWHVWQETAAARLGFRERVRAIFLRSLPLYVGFVVCASPMALSTLNAGSRGSLYTREQCILFYEARKAITDWEAQHSLFNAITQNAVKGLTLFNNNEFDNSYAYINLGHGFVDPLTGVLIWVGVLLLFRARRARKFRANLLIGFLIIWLVVGTLMTRNPAYCRFLVIMPFATFFAMQGCLLVARRAARLLRLTAVRAWTTRLSLCALLGIAAWNAKIVYDHYWLAVNDHPEHITDIVGNEVASSIRYVRERAASGVLHYIIVTDDEHPYQPYGGDFWRNWICSQVPASAVVSIARPGELDAEPMSLKVPEHVPCVVLMNGDLGKKYEAKMRARYPTVKFVPLTLAVQQVAVEITPAPQR